MSHQHQMVGISLWQGLLTGCQSDASGAEIESLKTQPIFAKSEDVRYNYRGLNAVLYQSLADKPMTSVKGAALSLYLVMTYAKQCYTPKLYAAKYAGHMSSLV